MSKPTAIDLFAGAGGVTQGLRDAGFQVLAAVEADAVAAKSYRANHARVRLLIEDIRTTDAMALKKELGLRRGQLTLLKACPPCQSYSSLGKRDVNDDRNELVGEVWKFVRVLRPRVVMLENVGGLARDERLGKLVRQLRRAGYSVKTYLLNATLFGVPQRRRRLIVVAVRGGSATLPESLVDLLPAWFRRTGMQTAGEAFARTAGVDPKEDPLHRPRTTSKAVAARIKAIPVGGSRLDLPAKHQLRCHKNRSSEATASYGRVRNDEPAPTMTTRCTTAACGQFVHPTKPRALTLREAATIQTFPIAYRFSGGPAQVERQIGNALPVRMARGLGLCVQSLLAARA